MTLSSVTVKDTFSGSTAKSYDTTWSFWNSSEVSVILVSSSGNETTWTEGTEYTVTGGGGGTGTIAVSTGPTDYVPTTVETLILKSNVLDIQETSLPAGGVFPSTSVEQELDRTVRRIQQQTEELDRTIKLTDSSTYTGLTIPDPSASAILRWNAGATALENATLGTSTQSIALPVSIAQGGTNATTEAAARVSLGLEIGSDIAGVSSSVSTDHGVPRFDGTGMSLQNSGWTVDDSDLMTAAGTLDMADNLVDGAELVDTGEKYLDKTNLGATPVFDFSAGHVQRGVVDQQITSSTFSNFPASGTAGSFTLELVNGSAFAITWPTATDWAGGTPPTFTASGTDFITFLTRDGGTTVHAFVAGLDMS